MPPRLHVINLPRVPAGEGAPAGYSLAPCANCAAPCCATLRARLTTVEAQRIASALSVPLDDVVTRVPGAGHHHPWFTVPIPLADGPVTLALRQRDGSRCAFLHEVGARGRCAIHALRPGVCRIYPYPVREGTLRTDVGSAELCPIGWAVDDAAERAVRRDMAAWRADIAREEQHVARWARQVPRRRTWERWTAWVSGA